MFGAPQPPRDRSRSPSQGQEGVPNHGGDWRVATPGDPSQSGPLDAATFLKDHIIDDRVLMKFLSLTPDQQSIVMMRGALDGSRDPSAVLSARINHALHVTPAAANPNPQMNSAAQPNPAAMMQMMMQMMGQMTGQVPGQMPGGKGGNIVPRSQDWFCQRCGDHQFAKNKVCRNCGADRPTDGSEFNPPTVETFIAMHPALEEHAVARLLALDAESQDTIIRRGSLMGSRGSTNPTAVLLGRIKTVQQQGGAGGPPMGGKGATAPQQGGMDQMQMMQMMMQMMQQVAQCPLQPQQQQMMQQMMQQMQQMQQPMQQMQMGGMQQTMQPQQSQLGATMLGGTNNMTAMMQPQQPQFGASMLGDGSYDMMSMTQPQQQAQFGQAQFLGQPQLDFGGTPHM